MSLLSSSGEFMRWIRFKKKCDSTCLKRGGDHHWLYLRFYLLIISLSSVLCLSLGCTPSQRPKAGEIATIPMLDSLIQDLINLSRSDLEATRRKLTDLIPEVQELQLLLSEEAASQDRIDQFIKNQRNVAIRELPIALKTAFESGLTQIQLTKVGPHMGSQNGPGDLELLENLKTRSSLYTLRLTRPNEDQGLRISGWVYTPDHGWRVLLKYGELLMKRGDLQ